MIRATVLSVLRRPFLNTPRLARVTRHNPGSIPPIPRNFASSRPTRAVYYVRFGGDSKPPSGKGPWIGHKEQWAIGLGVFGVVYYVSHLEQVPETGRWRFMVISRNFEAEIGKMMYDDILETHANQVLPPNHIIARNIRRIAARILSASNLGEIRGYARDPTPVSGSGQPWGGDGALWDTDSQSQNSYQSEMPREWEVVVVDDPNINAMSIPGVIFVFTGILPTCKDERGLAAVLSHEIGHVVARHTAESISSQAIFLFLLTIVEYCIGDALGLMSLAQHLLIGLPHSRKMEYEADKIGLTLMSRACYDPKGAVEMFSRLHRIQSDAPTSSIDFFNTHPSSAKRVEELSKLLPEAYDVLHSNSDCAAIRARFGAPRKSFNVRSLGIGFDDVF